MQIEQWAVDRVRPYPSNPRKNDAAVDAVAKSIVDFGFRQPIVVDGDGVIVVGHTRWKAAQKLGLATVPVHVASELSPEKARGYRLADNRLNEIAQWDDDLPGVPGHPGRGHGGGGRDAAGREVGRSAPGQCRVCGEYGPSTFIIVPDEAPPPRPH